MLTAAKKTWVKVNTVAVAGVLKRKRQYPNNRWVFNNKRQNSVFYDDFLAKSDVKKSIPTNLAAYFILMVKKESPSNKGKGGKWDDHANRTSFEGNLRREA